MKDERKTKAQLIEELTALRQRASAPEVDAPGELHDVFDAIPLPATLIDGKGVVLDVNPAFLDLARAHGIEIRKEDRIGGHIASYARTEAEQTQIGRFSQAILGG